MGDAGATGLGRRGRSETGTWPAGSQLPTAIPFINTSVTASFPGIQPRRTCDAQAWHRVSKKHSPGAKTTSEDSRLGSYLSKNATESPARQPNAPVPLRPPCHISALSAPLLLLPPPLLSCLGNREDPPLNLQLQGQGQGESEKTCMVQTQSLGRSGFQGPPHPQSPPGTPSGVSPVTPSPHFPEPRPLVPAASPGLAAGTGDTPPVCKPSELGCSLPPSH